MSNLRGKIFNSLTGLKGADTSGAAGGDLRGMLLAVGGSSKRTKSGVDHAAAATALGVSERTVRRWLHSAEVGEGPRPSGDNAKKLASAARQAASTKAGRRRIARQQGMAANLAGRDLVITGMQGPLPDGTPVDNNGMPISDTLRPRRRQTQVQLLPEDAEDLVRAWEAKGEAGFLEWANGRWGDDDTGYLPGGWRFYDVDDVDVSGKR